MASRSILQIASILTLLAALPGCKTTDNGGPDDGDDGTEDDGGDVAREPFFLPTGEPDNTSAPRVEVDADGGIHAIYPAYAGGRAYYAYCAADCGGSEDVKVVPFETDGTTANAMIALDAGGRPQVLLSTFQSVYYAAPSGDPTDPSSWQIAKIIDHHGDREVTGEALALDRDGRPRFVMHTYVAYLGIGQKTPETQFVRCDSDCFDPASWTQSTISDQIWQQSTLRIDSAGSYHLATVAQVVDENGSHVDMGAYARCDADCADGASWSSTGLLPAYTNELEAVAIEPAISMELTSANTPRVVMLANADFQKNVVYFACDTGCPDGTGWSGTILSDSADIGAGLDLALEDDHPRFAYTYSYNIGIAHCDDADCSLAESKWDLEKVEAGSEMDPDEIFLWENCDVGAWFLHSPSLALDDAGNVRVGYQARDISGGWDNPDPVHLEDCEAGTDMTWSRMALLGAF